MMASEQGEAAGRRLRLRDPFELSGYVQPPRWYEIPWRQPQFWATQALVILIAVAHTLFEGLEIIDTHSALYVVPLSFYFVPVVYAATSFGVAGSVPTALWCAVLSIPNVSIWHGGAERAGEVFQMGVIVLVAVFVGTRVDRQQRAREEAEEASAALQLSESKYRGLFESSGEGIIVLREDGSVVECNHAASQLIGQPPEAVRGRDMESILPLPVARSILAAARAGSDGAPDVALPTAQRGTVWVHPVLRPLAGEEGLTHVLLRDVTEQRSRQERLETYAGEILNAQEEERRRVAQELHDDTIQSLIALCRLLDAREPGDANGTELREYAESIVDRVRGFVQGLRPPALDDLGLSEAIRRSLLDMRDRTGMEVEFDVAGRERRLPPEIELVLFRVAQEALHNVERHSEAREVRVALAYGEPATHLSVHDDGRGFIVPENPDRLPAERKLGLMGMRERARTVGAHLEIRSTPGGGTTVRIEVPNRAPSVTST